MLPRKELPKPPPELPGSKTQSSDAGTKPSGS